MTNSTQYVLRVNTQICSFCDWNETQSTFMQRGEGGKLTTCHSAPEAKFACEIVQEPLRRVPICQRCAPQRTGVKPVALADAWQATLARKRAQAEIERQERLAPKVKPAPTLKDIL